VVGSHEIPPKRGLPLQRLDLTSQAALLVQVVKRDGGLAGNSLEELPSVVDGSPGSHDLQHAEPRTSTDEGEERQSGVFTSFHPNSLLGSKSRATPDRALPAPTRTAPVPPGNAKASSRVGQGEAHVRGVASGHRPGPAGRRSDELVEAGS